MWTFDYESKKKFQFTYKINDLNLWVLLKFSQLNLFRCFYLLFLFFFNI